MAVARPPKPLPITAISFDIETIEQIEERHGAAAEGSETGPRAVEAFSGGRHGVDFPVGEIVAHLISDTEIAAEGGQRALLRAGYAGEERAGADGEFKKRDGLQGGETDAMGLAFDIVKGEIERLAGDHAVAVERREKPDLEIEEPRQFARMAVKIDDGTGGEGDQAEGGEQGVGLAEGDVDGGTAATERVVIHAGQVVHDQRGAMEEFDGGGGAEAQRRGGSEHFGDAEGEEGAKPLAASEDGVAHGFGYRRRGDERRREQAFELVLDPLLAGEEGVELDGGSGH